MKFPILAPTLLRQELNVGEGDTLMPHIFAMTKEGPAIICDEGVGWVFDENDESVIVSYGTSYTITLEQAKRCISDEDIDLDIFIGTYNDRYRRNLSLWKGMTEDVDQSAILVQTIPKRRKQEIMERYSVTMTVQFTGEVYAESQEEAEEAYYDDLMYDCVDSVEATLIEEEEDDEDED